MSPDEWPEWLPADWTVQIRKINQRKVKSYVDPEGNKFYSKPQVFQHLKKINKSPAVEMTQNGNGSTVDLSLEPNVTDINEVPVSANLTPGGSGKKSKESDGILAGDGSSSQPRSSKRKNGVSKWLPDGWKVVMKTRETGSSSGTKYKIYIDPSGRKFFSKPQVEKYLANTNSGVTVQREGDKSSTEPDQSQRYEVNNDNTEKKTESNQSIRLSSDYEVISRTPVDGLPPGWIKEIRLKKRGQVQRKDPLYLDPLSSYMFFSKKDALRYLDSGDVKRCVMRPLKRDTNEEYSHDANLTVTGGGLTSPPVPSKGTETSKELTSNGCVAEPKTNESGTENTRKRRSITGDGYFSTPAAQKDEESDWLPEGWVVEVNVRNSGMKYKCFKESATGKKLYSKPQVLNYLANGSIGSNSRKRKENESIRSPDSSQNSKPATKVGRPKGSLQKNNIIQNSNYKEVIATSPADGLPPGWIKEIRTKIYSTHERKDPFYTDPLTGYIFRSKVDAMRYIETGDISLCAIRPKMKDSNGNEIPVPLPPGQKPVKTATKKQLFEEAENFMEKQHNEVPPTDTARGKRITKRSKSSPISPARSSKRQKGVTPETDPRATGENGSVQEKQMSGGGVNLEKQAAAAVAVDDDHLSFQLEDDPDWAEQCIDFAVKTLTGEFPANNGQEENVGVGTGVNETTPTKVN